MEAIYDNESRLYTVTGINVHDAHVLIWGGNRDAINAAEERLRQALVAAEDGQMTDEEYVEIFQGGSE